MKAERISLSPADDVINTYASIFELIGMEEEEARAMSEDYLAMVLRRTGMELAGESEEKKPGKEMRDIGELAEYLGANFEEDRVTEELGRQYILFYGEWNNRVLPLLPPEKRKQAEAIIKNLGDQLIDDF